MRFYLFHFHLYEEILAFLYKEFHVPIWESEQRIKSVCQDAEQITNVAFYTKYKIRNASTYQIPLPVEILILAAAFPCFSVFYYYRTQEMSIVKKNAVLLENFQIPIQTKEYIHFHYIALLEMNINMRDEAIFRCTQKEKTFVRKIKRRERRNGLLVAARMKNGAYFHVLKWIVLFL